MSIVLGIDFGSDKCVVAFLHKKQVVDILQNEASERDTPLVVPFYFGSAGAGRADRDQDSQISQLKRLIGRQFDEPSFAEERTLLPYKTSRGPNGEVMLNRRYQNEDREFTAAEMLGMFLNFLKGMAETATGSTISECAIGIPSYLTDQQRRDYLLAAEGAGLNPLQLFHDGAATALDYGIYRNLPHGKETNVVFVDIGHCGTQITAVKFVSGMAVVLAHSFDRDLGGRDFDSVIFKHFATKFYRQHNADVLRHPKASFRLRVACENVKIMLSSNMEAPIDIESLMDGKDLNGVITRKEFEALSRTSGLLDKIRTVCGNVLGESGLSAEQIHSVELVGSGSRIPMILFTLEEFFGRKVSCTPNGSECVAKGCAVQCAMLSLAHKITTFAVQDIFPFSISLQGSITVAKGMPLLTTKEFVLHPSTMVNTFSKEKTKFVELSYADVKELPRDTSTTINWYRIDSIDERQDADVVVRIQFNRHGIICVQYVLGTIMESGRSSRRLPVLKDSEPLSGVFVQHILKGAQYLETKLAEKDSAKEHAKLLRDDLKSNIFQIRNELLRTIVQSAIWTSISEKLHNMEEWLYGPGADESGDVYKGKMNELYTIRREIEAEQERAITRAKEREKEVSGRRQSFMSKDDRVINAMGKLKLVPCPPPDNPPSLPAIKVLPANKSVAGTSLVKLSKEEEQKYLGNYT